MGNKVRGARLRPSPRAVRSGSEGGGEAPGGGNSLPACRPSIRTIGVGHSVGRYLVYAANILSCENFKVLDSNSWKLAPSTTFVSEAIISNQWPCRYSTTETCEVFTHGARVIAEYQGLANGIPANYKTRMAPDASKKSVIYSDAGSCGGHLENDSRGVGECFRDAIAIRLAHCFREPMLCESQDASRSEFKVSRWRWPSANPHRLKSRPQSRSFTHMRRIKPSTDACQQPPRGANLSSTKFQVLHRMRLPPSFHPINQRNQPRVSEPKRIHLR